MNTILDFIAQHYLVIMYVINSIICLGIIFFDRKSPVATLAWVMILFLLPGVGFILYLVFSQNIARLKVSRLTQKEEQYVSELRKFQDKQIRKGVLDDFCGTVPKWQDLVKFNVDYGNSVMTLNDSVELIYDGKQKFSMLLNDIRNAESSINVCYFIIKNDEVGTELINALTEKAAEGLEVRLLIDAMGSKSIGDVRLSDFTAAGGKVAYYFKPFVKRLFIRFNYRNHRKIVVIDNKIGYTGGFNIAKEYLGLKKKFGYWRDTHIRIIGNAVRSLNERFYIDWRFASGEDMDIMDSVMDKIELTAMDGDIPIQIVSNGADTGREIIKMAMIKMISNAKESIYIQTPYLVPDQSVIEALKIAANSGVDVNVMIPCMPDHPFVYRTTLYNSGELIKDGVNIHIYENGFLHAKTLVVDNEVATVGSTNFDIRSFRLNFETNAFIYHEGIAGEMTEQYMRDIELSRAYTQEDRDNESVWEKGIEKISRLLTDIL